MKASKSLKCFALILASVAFGKAFASNEKSICDQIGRDRFKCQQASSICVWDDEDQRCEAYNQPQRCDQWRNNPAMCDAQSGCAWDGEDQRCEEISSGGTPGPNPGPGPIPAPVPPPATRGCFLSNGQYVPHGYIAYDFFRRQLICLDGSWYRR